MDSDAKQKVIETAKRLAGDEEVFDRPRMLREADRLEAEIAKYNKEIEDLTVERRSIKRVHGLWGILGVLLLTLFFTSSCSLHAGKILAQWDPELLVAGLRAYLQGLMDMAEGTNIVLYVLSFILTVVVMLPISLVFSFPYTFLRIVEEVLRMLAPVTVPFLALAELALVLFVLVKAVVLAVSESHAATRDKRSSFDERINTIKGYASSASAKLEKLKGSPEYAEAEREWAARKPWIDRFYQSFEDWRKAADMQIGSIIPLIPQGVSITDIEPYMNKDLGLTATAIMMLSLDSKWKGKWHRMSSRDVEDFLADFKSVYYGLLMEREAKAYKSQELDEELMLYNELGLSSEELKDLGLTPEDFGLDIV